MAIDWSFLSNNSVGGSEYEVPLTGEDKMLTTGQMMGNKMNDFFKDPNNLRLLSDMGSRFSQGQSAGQAIGDAGQSNIRRTAYQQAVGKQQKEQADQRAQLIEALRNGTALKPIGDLSGHDEITFNANGTYTVKGGKTDKTSGSASGSGGGNYPATLSDPAIENQTATKAANPYNTSDLGDLNLAPFL